MSIKVLGGIAKGRSLFVPKGDLIRPTSVRLRRKFYDAFQDWEGVSFIDLCAGTGAMGIEAWSRGAAKVHLVEFNHKVFIQTKKSIEMLSSSFSSELQKRPIKLTLQDAKKWLVEFKKKYSCQSSEEKENTVIFLDPPYQKHNLYEDIILKELFSQDWFIGFVWIESDSKKGLSLEYWEESRLKIKKSFTQGDSYLIMLTRQ